MVSRITNLKQEWFLKTGQEEAVLRLGKDFQFCLVWTSVTCFLVSPCLSLLSLSSNLHTLCETLELRCCNTQQFPVSVIYSDILLFIIQHFLSLSILKFGVYWVLGFIFQWSCAHQVISQLSLCPSLELMSPLQHHPSIFPCSVCSFPRGCKFDLPLILFIHHGCLGAKKGNVDITTCLLSPDLS